VLRRGPELAVRGKQNQIVWRAVGAVDALLAKAEAMGQCWLKGIGVARQRRKRAAADGVTQSGTTTRHSSAAL
jgi:hypothetical protein